MRTQGIVDEGGNGAPYDTPRPLFFIKPPNQAVLSLPSDRTITTTELMSPNPVLPEAAPRQPSTQSIELSEKNVKEFKKYQQLVQKQAKELGGDNQLHVYPMHPALQDPTNVNRTLTNEEIKKYSPKPDYYDPETGLTVQGPGMIITGLATGMTLGLTDFDIKRENIRTMEGKALFYSGKIGGEFLAAYGLGEIIGGGAGILEGTRVGTILGRTAGRVASSKVGRIIGPAAKGTLKGAIYGVEAGKAIAMKSGGASWLDVIGEVGSDVAGIYGFEKGFLTGYNAMAPEKTTVRTREFLEGKIIDTETRKGTQVLGTRRVIVKTTPKGDVILGASTRTPEGTMTALQMRGSRDVDILLANKKGASILPHREMGVEGVKFWKKSAGAETMFFLHDPPTARAQLITSVKEVPGARSLLTSLRAPFRLTAPPSPQTIELISASAFAGTKILTSPPSFEVEEQKKKEQGVGTTLIPKRSPELIESTKQELIWEQKQEQRRKRGLIQGPEQKQGRAQGQRQRSLKLVVQDQKLQPLIQTAKRSKTPKPPEPPLPSLGGKRPPQLVLNKKERKKKKKKRKKKTELLGEIDLVTANILDAMGVEKVVISKRKFQKLWESGSALIGEGFEVVKSPKPKKRGKKRKGWSLW